MPTGYTIEIEDGRITTGKDFLKLCTRAFGVAIRLKDEPLSVPTPTRIEPDTYYKDRIDREKAELEKAKNMSFEDAKAKMVKSHADRVKMCKSMAEKALRTNEKYAKVRAEVEAWNPPTEAHYDLKKFALEQIDMCIEKQEWIDKLLEQSNEKLDDSNEAVKDFINEEIEFCRKSVERAEKGWNEELRRVIAANVWMEEFLNSL